MMDEEPSGEAKAESRVLLVHEEMPVRRLVRESIESFTHAEVVTTPNAEYAFELAVKMTFDLFIFQLTLPVLHGELLYDLLSKAWPYCHAGETVAPSVIYIAEDAASQETEELRRDARVKAVLGKPLRIDRILASVEGVLVPRETPISTPLEGI